jgi:hypothetical protein
MQQRANRSTLIDWHVVGRTRKSAPENGCFALVQRARDALLHEVNVAAESVMRDKENHDVVALPALGHLVQRVELVQQL